MGVEWIDGWMDRWLNDGWIEGWGWAEGGWRDVWMAGRSGLMNRMGVYTAVT